MRCARPLFRLAILSFLVGGGIAFWKQRQRKLTTSTVNPEWPPFEPTTPVSSATTSAFTEPLVDSQMKWVAPVGGACPDGYPIKGNDNSGIFHIPGGRFYERTVPERCYATADDALADGYRQAKA
ncbi:MAG: hypothetical protein LH616_07210 [Ilumatobacteraceae bacterium]|nr:hypothetical protein [Ilumatobacteraceae bacterium]